MPQVQDIYYNEYWLAARCNFMQGPLDLVHFDTSVNFGVFTANKFLQRALGVVDDGLIGPVTLAALRSAQPNSVARSICDQRIQFRHNRVLAHPELQKFLLGWLNRDNALRGLTETQAA